MLRHSSSSLPSTTTKIHQTHHLHQPPQQPNITTTNTQLSRFFQPPLIKQTTTTSLKPFPHNNGHCGGSNRKPSGGNPACGFSQSHRRLPQFGRLFSTPYTNPSTPTTAATTTRGLETRATDTTIGARKRRSKDGNLPRKRQDASGCNNTV